MKKLIAIEVVEYQVDLETSISHVNEIYQDKNIITVNLVKATINAEHGRHFGLEYSAQMGLPIVHSVHRIHGD